MTKHERIYWDRIITHAKAHVEPGDLPATGQAAPPIKPDRAFADAALILKRDAALIAGDVERARQYFRGVQAAAALPAVQAALDEVDARITDRTKRQLRHSPELGAEASELAGRRSALRAAAEPVGRLAHHFATILAGLESPEPEPKPTSALDALARAEADAEARKLQARADVIRMMVDDLAGDAIDLGKLSDAMQRAGIDRSGAATIRGEIETLRRLQPRERELADMRRRVGKLEAEREAWDAETDRIMSERRAGAAKIAHEVTGLQAATAGIEREIEPLGDLRLRYAAILDAIEDPPALPEPVIETPEPRTPKRVKSRIVTPKALPEPAVV